MLVVQIYVDDIIFGATNEILCKGFTELMQREFEMSLMGELNYFIGLQVKQTKDGIFISQIKYIKEIIKKFGMESSKEISTPMSPTCKLDKDEDGINIDQKLYQDIIGSLLYLTTSRPDILFSICVCARFQSTPKESHMLAAKRIIRYLKENSNLGLWDSKNSLLNLVEFSDVDYGGCKIDRKSTSGTYQFLGLNLISWYCKK